MGSVTRIRADGSTEVLHGAPADSEAPEAESSFHKSVVTTKLDQLVNWARSGSLWPLPFGTACCAIEFMSVVSAHYDLSRFGAEVVRFSPRQSDVLIVAGTVTDKQSPIMKQIWEQMAEPKWCIAMGVCASSGGFYRAYHVTQGIDEVIPVDVYVPGCPPTPEGLIYAILELQRKIRGERRLSEGGLGGRRLAQGGGGDGERRKASRGETPREDAILLNDPQAITRSADGSGGSRRRSSDGNGGSAAGPSKDASFNDDKRALPTVETTGGSPRGSGVDPLGSPPDGGTS
jgi:NADH-quinone oxidoreductase subunit B